MKENDKLIKKLEKEFKDLKEYVKNKGVDYAIDKAYEITVKQEIIDCITYDNILNESQRKALLKCNNILEQCYDDWLKCDGNLRERLNFSVDETINYITEDFKKCKIKNKNLSR